MGVLHALSNLTLDELVLAAQANHDNDSDEMVEIFDRFSHMIRSTAQRVAPTPDLRDDAEQGARFGLFQAVRTYRPDRAHFAGYAPLVMRREAVKRIKSFSATSTPPSDIGTPKYSERCGARRHTYAAPEPKAFTIAGLSTALTPEQKDLVVAHYVADLTVTDIASTLGISKSAVSQRLKTIHKTLRPLLAEVVAA